MPNDLTDKRILITSGPTRAHIDAVRYISNRSSGRLGRRIALEALALGARVTHVIGPQSAAVAPDDVSPQEWGRLRTVPVETVVDLLQALQQELTSPERYDALVHAMAVLDYVPEQTRTDKVPGNRKSWEVRFVPTPKVIRQVKVWSPRTFLVGFKLEADVDEDRLLEIALAAMRASRADLVVANDLKLIRDETHPALIVGSGGTVLARPRTKSEIARELCRILAESLR
jgi:phosphopantothenoylcysteine synthetase/decarboxylase